MPSLFPCRKRAAPAGTVRNRANGDLTTIVFNSPTPLSVLGNSTLDVWVHALRPTLKRFTATAYDALPTLLAGVALCLLLCFSLYTYYDVWATAAYL